MTDNPADALAERVAFAMLANEGTGKAWGIHIEEAREGYSRIRMKLTADMLNGHGKAHGGMVYALADRLRLGLLQPQLRRLAPGDDGLPRRGGGMRGARCGAQ